MVADHVSRYLPGGWTENEKVSVHSYQKDGEGGEENTSRLQTSSQLAHNFLVVVLVLHFFVSELTMLGLRDQYLLVRSIMVRGMVKQQRRRSEIARFTMKMFLVVNRTYYCEEFTNQTINFNLIPAHLVSEEGHADGNITKNTNTDEKAVDHDQAQIS